MLSRGTTVFSHKWHILSLHIQTLRDISVYFVRAGTERLVVVKVAQNETSS